MKHQILCEDKNIWIIERLLKIRWILEDADDFLEPKFKKYWIDPLKLNDMDLAVNRIIEAIENKEKIMILWDYDVDGITSSFILYKFISKFLWYKDISIMYPDRIEEWYGIKKIHLDRVKEKWVNLVITVDNWITSIQEAKYAKEIGIDLIITDHHKNLEEIPEAIAVVNPVISEKYDFKSLAGVWVAFKLICAILDSTEKITEEKKNKIFNYFLPIVAIWTVADIVPLVGENRLLVKKWLELINNYPSKIPSSLKWFLNYLNLKEINTFHIGFVIWPRINAWWRIDSPYNSLKTLLSTWDKQIEALKKIDLVNSERKKLQEEALKIAEQLINIEDKILIAENENFHEWIVGIVSGRLTEKYHKPSIVFKIDKEKWLAVASLRWPEYFNVIEMIQKHNNLLERSGWHKQAWWLTIKLDNLEKFKKQVKDYCQNIISDEALEKTTYIDTYIDEKERDIETILWINKLAPFGEWNKEPNLLFKDIKINKIEKVWKNGNGHMKINGSLWKQKINFLFWGKWDLVKNIENEKKIDIIWKVKKDNFNWWYFVNWIEII